MVQSDKPSQEEDTGQEDGVSQTLPFVWNMSRADARRYEPLTG